MQRTTLQIDGMTCDHCVGRIKKALTSLDGVMIESVSLGSAAVQYDETHVTLAEIDAAIAAAGYSVHHADVARAE